jgi:hypothetical protein
MKRITAFIAFFYILLVLIVSSYSQSGFTLLGSDVEVVFSWLADLFLVLFALVIVFYRREIIETVLELLRLKKKGEPLSETRKPMWELLIFLAMLPILLAMYEEQEKSRRATEFLGSTSNMSIQNSSIGGSFVVSNNASATQLGSTVSAFQIPLILAIVLFTFVVLLAMFVGYVEFQRELKGKEEDSLSREVRSEVKTALRRIEAPESDLRHEIVRLYNSFCKTVEGRGVKIEKSWTAREIMSIIVTLIPALPREAVQELTGLFELALYSNYPLGEQHRALALSALRRIYSTLNVPEGVSI